MVDGSSESDRLRALLLLMQEFGVTKLVTPEGYSFERPPVSALEAAAAAANSLPGRAPAAASKDDLEEELDEAEREARDEKDLEVAWRDRWERIGASSGSAIPPFPGPKKALAFLGRTAS